MRQAMRQLFEPEGVHISVAMANFLCIVCAFNAPPFMAFGWKHAVHHRVRFPPMNRRFFVLLTLKKGIPMT